MSARHAAVAAALAVALVAVASADSAHGGSATASSSASVTAGDQVVGKLTVEGVGTAIDLRGFDLGGVGGTASSGHETSPGTVQSLATVTDVTKESPALLRMVLHGDQPHSVRADLYASDGSGTVDTTVSLDMSRASKFTVHSSGASGERLLLTITWDLSKAKVTVTNGGNSVCWDNARVSSC